MNNKQRIIFYNLNPMFFYDSNGDGVGDLQGLAKKIKYFSYLGVEEIIIPNILGAYGSPKHSYKSISPKIGTLFDFKKVLKLASNLNIKINIQINITTIHEHHNWFQKALHSESNEKDDIFQKAQSEEDKKNAILIEKTNTYYLVDSKTQEIKINWDNDLVILKFLKVLEYWIDLGVTGFVFKNFEDIIENKNEGNNLRLLYKKIKEYNKHVIVIGKSSLIGNNEINRILMQENKIFDYFISDKTSLIGTNKKMGNDAYGVFSIGKLIKQIDGLVHSNKNIFSLGSSKTGRIISRWGNEGNFWKQSAKTFAIHQFFSSGSVSIYYGEELGLTNIGLSALDNYQDKNILIRKNRLHAEYKLSEKDFLEAQKSQNPINSHSPMQWDDSKNAGFSVNEELIVPIAKTYNEINVKQQYNDKSSILTFYRDLIKLLKNTEFQYFLNTSERKIDKKWSVFNKIHTYKLNRDYDGILIYTNFSMKTKKFKPPKKAWIILNSYYGIDFSQPITELHPFETIVYYRNIRWMKQRTVFGIEPQTYGKGGIRNDFIIKDDTEKHKRIKSNIFLNSVIVDKKTKKIVKKVVNEAVTIYYPNK